MTARDDAVWAVAEHWAGARSGRAAAASRDVARATKQKGDGPVWAVAVSGGGDSIALMHLLKDHARVAGLAPPIVLTVDHGLREYAAKDARQVAAWAKQAGLKAHILTWRGAKPKTGIEAAAREARYRLMGAWLVKHKIATLFVGHTQDDQAETFLMRLARGSGLDGLSAMGATARWPVEGFPSLCVRRPLLTLRRDALRAWLTSVGQDWLDDPMNDDAAFDRVKIRKAQAALADAGLTPARIAAAAAHLARARAALEVMTQAVLARAAKELQGGSVKDGVLLDAVALAAAPREVALRALAAVLMGVSGRAYRPRFEALERLFDGLATGRPATLHGCHIARAGKKPAAAAAQIWLVKPENPRKTGSSVKSGKSAKPARRVAASA